MTKPTPHNVITQEFTQTYNYLLNQNRILIGQAGDGIQTLYFDGQGIDEHLGQVTATGVKGYQTDHLGSVLNTVTGGPGNEFDPWGGLIGATPGFSKTSQPVQYAFAGRQWDQEDQLYYVRARQYSASLGRFISPDPSGFKSGDTNLYRYVDGVGKPTPAADTNLYEYTSNNPVNFVDPLGLYQTSPGGGGAGSGYLNIGVSAGSGFGVVGGVYIGNGIFYPYIGGGLNFIPGFGVTVTGSSCPSTGMSDTIGVSAGIAGQVNLPPTNSSPGSPTYEFGAGSPGAGFNGTYTFGPYSYR